MPSLIRLIRELLRDAGVYSPAIRPAISWGKHGSTWRIIPFNKRLTNMIRKSPRPGVVGPLPNDRNLWHINQGSLNYLQVLQGSFSKVRRVEPERFPLISLAQALWCQQLFFSELPWNAFQKAHIVLQHERDHGTTKRRV